MKPHPWKHLDRWRLKESRYGAAFRIPHNPTNVTLLVLASAAGGWEHVSVSLQNRTPNWREMEFACRQFWEEDEAVMQLHPPRSEWVSNHANCLHLWRPTDGRIPMPPSFMVGARLFGALNASNIEDAEPATAEEIASWTPGLNDA